MESSNYLWVGIFGIIALSLVALGSGRPTSNDETMTKVMVSLDNSQSSTVFLAYKPTAEVFSRSGMTLTFTENKVGSNNMKCELTCQPMEEDTK